MVFNSVLSVTLFLASQGWMMAAALVFYYMLGQINAKADLRIHFLGMDIGKLSIVFEEHRRLFPESKMYLYFASSFVFGVLFFLAASVAFLLQA